MDRLLRAVEKGAAIPAAAVPPPAPQAYAGATRQAYAPSTSSRTGPTGYGAAPQAYGPGSASDPSAARAREHAQRLEAERQRSEAARRAHAERQAQEQREREARAGTVGDEGSAPPPTREKSGAGSVPGEEATTSRTVVVTSRFGLERALTATQLALEIAERRKHWHAVRLLRGDAM